MTEPTRRKVSLAFCVFCAIACVWCLGCAVSYIVSGTYGLSLIMVGLTLWNVSTGIRAYRVYQDIKV